jgi:hypothetical protein
LAIGCVIFAIMRKGASSNLFTNSLPERLAPFWSAGGRQFPNEASFLSHSASCSARMSAKRSAPSAIRPLPTSLNSEAGLALPDSMSRNFFLATSRPLRRAVEFLRIGGTMAIALMRPHLTLHAHGAPFFLPRDGLRRLRRIHGRAQRHRHMHQCHLQHLVDPFH